MIRKIIKIDEEKCNGCGLCVQACHEGAIELKNGKAYLAKENYCDGLGDCLPACPLEAITFEEREAPAYDENLVLESKGYKKLNFNVPSKNNINANASFSMLKQWPIKIKLAPIAAAFYDDANLLVAADCTAFAYGDFHNEFIENHITLIGCPKLDGVDYSEKLSYILANNNIKSIKIVRMEVPCCGGMEMAVKKAIKNCGKAISFSVDIISTKGKIVNR